MNTYIYIYLVRKTRDSVFTIVFTNDFDSFILDSGIIVSVECTYCFYNCFIESAYFLYSFIWFGPPQQASQARHQARPASIASPASRNQQGQVCPQTGPEPK